MKSLDCANSLELWSTNNINSLPVEQNFIIPANHHRVSRFPLDFHQSSSRFACYTCNVYEDEENGSSDISNTCFTQVTLSSSYRRPQPCSLRTSPIALPSLLGMLYSSFFRPEVYSASPCCSIRRQPSHYRLSSFSKLERSMEGKGFDKL